MGFAACMVLGFVNRLELLCKLIDEVLLFELKLELFDFGYYRSQFG